jgi:hypothetical protein
MRENPYGIQYTGRIVHIKGGERRHVFNKKTGGALCGAGLHRDGKVIAGAVATSTGKKVDCLRCIKILYVDHAQRYLVERSLRPSAAGKRYKHAMVAGGRQGFAIGRKKTKNSTPELPYGPSSVADFRRGSNEHPTQTRLASKRQRAAARVRIIRPAAPAPRVASNPKPVIALKEWQKAMSRAEDRGDSVTIRALEMALRMGAVEQPRKKKAR